MLSDGLGFFSPALVRVVGRPVAKVGKKAAKKVGKKVGKKLLKGKAAKDAAAAKAAKATKIKPAAVAVGGGLLAAALFLL